MGARRVGGAFRPFDRLGVFAARLTSRPLVKLFLKQSALAKRRARCAD